MSITAVPSAILPNPVEPTGASTATGAVAAGGSSDALASLPTPAPQTPQAQAVSAATTSAAIRQSALAPLLADLAQAATLPSLPAPVQSAIAQVLATQLPIDPPPSAADLQAATTASGLFLEAQLAAGAPPSTSDLKAALLVTQQVLKTWLDSAASATSTTQTPGVTPASTQGAPAQNTPAPNTAPQTTAETSATPPLATPSASLPSVAPLAQAPAPAEPAIAATSPPAAPPTASQTSSPPAVQPGNAAVTAVADVAASSAEANSSAAKVVDTPAQATATPVPAQGSASPAPPVPATSTPSPPSATLPAASPPPTAPAPANVQTSVSLYAQALARVPLGDLFEDAQQGDADAPATAATSPQALSATPRTPPAPPYAGGPTTAQKPAPAGLASDAEPAAIARRLLTETGGAIARQELHQVASLPPAETSPRPTEAQSRWMFELPFATPQGSAVAQFEISRDSSGGAASAGEATWRARFTLDLEPLGPVHAQVAVSGARAGVTLWAERPAAAAALRAQQAVLSAGLEDAAFAANVSVHAGAPRRAAPPSGRFLDQAS